MKVLANDGLSEQGISLLRDANIEVFTTKQEGEKLGEFINENQIDVLLVRSATNVDQFLIDECPSLRVIGRCGVGLDNIDVAYAESLGIRILNTPNAATRSVAELVFAHFFSLARHLHNANREMPLEGEANFKGLKKSFKEAFELQGKTLAVVGFGRIGREVAKIGISLGMKVFAYNRTPKKQTLELSFFDGQKLNFEIECSTNLNEVLAQADFVSVNTSKTEGYLLDTPQLESMKEGAYLVNAARGGVVNEERLLHYIENGKLRGAALDVYENEPTPSIALLMNSSLSLSPHLGGNTIDAQQKIGIELAKELIKIKNEDAVI